MGVFFVSYFVCNLYEISEFIVGVYLDVVFDVK